MSLILEALNKADRERDEQKPVPHLQSIHGRITPPAAPKKHWGLYIVVALLVLILLLLITLLVRQAGLGAGAAPAPKPAQTTSALNAQLSAADTPTPGKPGAFNPAAAPLPATPTPPTASGLSTDVQSIYQEAKALPPAASQDVETLYEEEPMPQKKSSRSKSRLLEDLEAEATALDAEQTNSTDEAPVAPKAKPIEAPKPALSGPELDAETVKRLWEETKKEIPDAPENPNKVKTQINNAVEDNLAAYKEVPFLHDLPETFQATVPTLNYNNHIYSVKAGAVILNKKTYKVGQEVAPGLIIERIASDGVLFQYKGKRFKLAALNSWINI